MTLARARRATRPTEHAEQALLIQWADLATGHHPDLALLYAVPNGGHRHARVAVRLRAEGVRAGVPDLCLPVARGRHHGLYLELKRQGARPSDTSAAQRAWHAALVGQGYRVVVAHGWEAARDAILTYLALPTE